MKKEASKEILEAEKKRPLHLKIYGATICRIFGHIQFRDSKNKQRCDECHKNIKLW